MKNFIKFKIDGTDSKYDSDIRVNIDDIASYKTDFHQQPPITVIVSKSGKTYATQLTSDEIDKRISEAQQWIINSCQHGWCASCN